MKQLRSALAILLSAVLLFCSAAVSPCAAAQTTQSYLYASKYTKALNKYTSYKANVNENMQFAIPGLSDGTNGGVQISAGFFKDYIPQGICYSAHTQRYFMTAYSESKQNSVIFVLSKTGVYQRTLEIESYTAHAGGIACDNSRLYFVSGLSIYYIGLDAVAEALESSENTVTVTKSRVAVTSELCAMPVGDKADANNQFSSCSFCSFYGGLLWFGEFSVDTPGSDYPYRDGESFFFGVDISEPKAPVLKKVMTVPCQTQGADFFKDSDGNTYLVCSMSYGRNNASTARFYKINQEEWGEDNGYGMGTHAKSGARHFVHKNTNIKQVEMPNMMEDICTAASGTKQYLLSVYESGAKKYASSASYVMDRVSAFDIGKCLSLSIPAQNPSVTHLYKEFERKEPTCTESGYSKQKCCVCRKLLTQTVDAEGHDFTQKNENNAALCEDLNNGVRYYYSCANCNEIERNKAHIFAAQKTTLFGKIGKQKFAQKIEISLLKDGVCIQKNNLENGESGYFLFRDPEPGKYALRWSGKGILAANIENIELQEKQVLEIGEACTQRIVLIPGDLNADSVIDIADLSLLLSEGVYAQSGDDLPGDLNADGNVNLADVQQLLLADSFAKTEQRINFEGMN